MNDRPVLPRVPVLPLSQDWDALRARGLQRLQQFSGALWTDHNSHDPGITTLELLAYAITDLSYRMNLPIVDLLSDDTGQLGPPDLSGFVPAHEILPNAPRTAADYRRLLLRIEGVANAWAIARTPGRAETPVYADVLADALSHKPLNGDGQPNAEISISGLWDIRLDFEPHPLLGDMNETALDYRVTSDALKGVVLRLDCLAPDFINGVTDVSPSCSSHVASPVQSGAQAPRVFTTQLTLNLSNGHDTVLDSCLIRVVEDRPRFDRPPVVVDAVAIDALLALQGPESLVARFWDKQRARAALLARVSAALSANRGLCEDFRNISTVDAFRVGVCADVELAPDGDMEAVQAAVYHAIERYLAPQIRYRTLDEMLSQGLGVETIFNGPFHDTAFHWQGQLVFSKPGFVTDADLAAADLRQKVQVSDIVNLVMDIPGVTAIHGVTLRYYDPLDLAGPPQRWTLPVLSGQRPVFYAKGSKLLFHRAGIPYRAQPSEFARTLDALRAADRREVYVPSDQVLPQPAGRWRRLTDFQPVQHDFPETYGIGAVGLPGSASAERVAKARQFKAYLTVFDQLLGDYLAQLAGLRRIFSLDPNLAQTWFSLDICKAIAGTRMPQFADEFLTSAADYADAANRARLTESEDAFLKRRNRLLDHLIARFAERFADYATLMFRLDDNSVKTEADLISDKIDFLRIYPSLSRMRGQGANIHPEDPAKIWNSTNVSGLEQRAGRLLGIKNLTRRNLHCEGHLTALFGVMPVEGALRLVVLPAQDGDPHLFISDQVFDDQAAGIAAAETAYRSIRQRGGLLVRLRQNTQLFEVVLLGEAGFSLTHRPAFDTQADATAAARAIISRYDALLAADACNSEGLHLIEHILLRPHGPDEALMPVCLPKSGGPACGDEDPYSFRASLVLPYWPERFRDTNFRTLAERTFREEAPAHVQLRICWVGQRQMTDLDSAHRAWLTALRDGAPADLAARAADLIAVLASLSTVYPAATLHDCDLGEDDHPVRLGATALGLY